VSLSSAEEFIGIILSVDSTGAVTTASPAPGVNPTGLRKSPICLCGPKEEVRADKTTIARSRDECEWNLRLAWIIVPLSSHEKTACNFVVDPLLARLRV
jgi:hypothetical protein